VTTPPETCHCGSTVYVENSRASGWWKQYIDSDGRVELTASRGLRLKVPKTVTCAECGRRYLNPNHDHKDANP